MNCLVGERPETESALRFAELCLAGVEEQLPTVACVWWPSEFARERPRTLYNDMFSRTALAFFEARKRLLERLDVADPLAQLHRLDARMRSARRLDPVARREAERLAHNSQLEGGVVRDTTPLQQLLYRPAIAHRATESDGDESVLVLNKRPSR